MLHALRIALATLLLLSGASAAEFGPRRVLLAGSNVPSWVLRAGGVLPAVDCPFGSGGGPISSCWVNGTGIVQLSSLLSISRASNETYTDASGNLSFIGSNVLATGSAGLQAWEARTNLVLQSNNFGTFWSPLIAVAVTQSGASNGPDGNAGWSLNEGGVSSSTVHILHQTSLPTASGTNYSYSCYMKQGSLRFGIIGLINAADAIYATADLQLGTITQAASVGTGTFVSASITAAANGWYRVVVTGSLAAAGAEARITLSNTGTGGAAPSYAGTGTGFIGIFGAQLEAAAFPSPPIPTTTTSATRAADNITAIGTLAATLALPTASLIVKTNTSQQSLAGTLIDANGTVLLGKNVGNNGTTAVGATLSTSNTGTWTGANDLGLSWDATGGVIDLNGTTTTDATARTPAAPFHVGSTSGSSAFLDGNITRLTAFSSKLGAPQ